MVSNNVLSLSLFIWGNDPNWLAHISWHGLKPTTNPSEAMNACNLSWSWIRMVKLLRMLRYKIARYCKFIYLHLVDLYGKFTGKIPYMDPLVNIWESEDVFEIISRRVFCSQVNSVQKSKWCFFKMKVSFTMKTQVGNRTDWNGPLVVISYDIYLTRNFTPYRKLAAVHCHGRWEGSYDAFVHFVPSKNA